MKALISKMHMHSLIAVSVYVVLSAGFVLYALFCTGYYCSLGIVLPVFPWVFALPKLIGESVFGYLSFVGINIVLLYMLVYYLTRHKERRKMEEEE